MATRTISNTGGNYNVAATWVEGIVPTAADDIKATATSGPLTITAAAAALTVDFTNYTNTCTINSGQTWTVGANGGAIVFKLATGMTLAGTGTLTISNTTGNTSTITSAGKTVPWNVAFLVAVTHTVSLADNWTITGTLSAGGIKTFNGNKFLAQGNLNFSNSGFYGGTTTIEISGSANHNIVLNTFLTLATTINKSGGTFTFNSCVIYANLTYTAGTVSTTGSTITLVGTLSMATSGITWNNVTIGGNSPTSHNITFTNAFNLAGTWSSFSLGTITLTNCSNIGTIPAMNIPATSGLITYNLDNPITVSGTLTVTGTNGGVINGSTLYLQGNLALSGAAGIFGTGTLEMNGTSKTITSTAGAALSCNFTVNSATITLNSGSTLRFSTGSNTFKLNNSLLGTGVVAVTGSSRIDGGGNSINNFWVTTAGITVSFASGLIVNTQFQSLAGTAASRVLFNSTSAGVQRKFTLANNGTATQSVLFTNATDIDSGDGQTIWTFGTPVATLTNTINWNPLAPGGYNESGFIY